MKYKFLSVCTPIGLALSILYQIYNRFFGELSDVAACIVLIICIGFLISGIAYRRYCIRHHKNPIDFSDI